MSTCLFMCACTCVYACVDNRDKRAREGMEDDFVEKNTLLLVNLYWTVPSFPFPHGMIQ